MKSDSSFFSPTGQRHSHEAQHQPTLDRHHAEHERHHHEAAEKHRAEHRHAHQKATDHIAEHHRSHAPRASAIGHNHHHPDHLHSHLDPTDEAADLQVLTDQFIESFQTAKDKIAFLELAKIPLEIKDPAGGPNLKLVDVQLTTEWQIATAGPSFGSRELSYLPFTGDMVRERTNLGFVYVSLEKKKLVDLREYLGEADKITPKGH